MRGRRLAAAVASCLIGCASLTINADVAPRSGDQFPRAYYLRRQQDPRAFTFRRAFVQQAERIRAARSSLMARVTAMSGESAAKEVVANESAIAVRGPRV